MDQHRWERIATLFHGALERHGTAREAFLRDACAGDDALRAEVDALLQADARPGSALDTALDATTRTLLAATPPPPETIGAYRILRPLGEGGMGIVYLAHDDALDRPVAIKVLRDAWVSERRRERFAHEQRLLARLAHPAIGRIYDAGTLDQGTPYFAMEYVDGGVPITDYCRAQRLPLHDVLSLFRAVCDAVHHAHQHAIVHRDLKPSNILIDRAGHVKLLDFGIAKHLQDGEPGHPTVGHLMTPAYAAPEQLQNAPVGVFTDVYALGLVLYELLTGTLPPAERRSSPDTPSAAAPPEAAHRIPADLDALCLTAIDPDPARRYATVDALRRDVDRFLAGRPLDARPAAWTYRVGKFILRNRGAVAAAAVMTMLTVVLIAFYTLQLARARDAALDEAARTRRVQQFMLDLFQGGDAAAGPADSLRVVTMIERGVQQARSLDADAAIQADLFQTLGTVYRQLGQYPAADSLLERALARRTAHFGREHPTVGETLVELGMLRAYESRFDEAEQLAHEGLAIQQRTRAPNHPRIGDAYSLLGYVYRFGDRYDEAIAALEKALRLYASAPSFRPDQGSAEYASIVSQLANVHYFRGDYAAADSLHRRALNLDRRLLGENHPHVAIDHTNIGNILLEWERYEDARAQYERAYAINHAYYGEHHPETAVAMQYLGRTHANLDNLAEAERWYARARAAHLTIYGPVHPRVAISLSDLGKLALRKGDIERADSLLTATLAICRATLPPGHSFTAAAQSNLAGVYLAQERYRVAEDTLRAAVDALAQSLPAHHSLTGIAHLDLGRALLLQDRAGDAIPHLENGYAIMMAQTRPPQQWLARIAEDLPAAYRRLGDDARAEALSDSLNGLLSGS